MYIIPRVLREKNVNYPRVPCQTDSHYSFHPSPVQFLSFFRPVTVLNLEPPPLISV